MTAPPKVGIALLNWNQYDDTALCLASLRESQFRPQIILVYDNGSTDGSAERLKEEFPEIELVLGERNYGFSEGNNRAAKILLDAGMDLIWVLNNDTKVPPDCLGTLVRTLEEDPGIGATSAKIWFMDESKPLCYAGAVCHPWTFEVAWRGVRELDTGQYDIPEDTGVLTGCCMLIRVEVLHRIGLFNKAFFIYAEDVEWSQRAVEHGIRLRYEPRAALWHKMFGSAVKGGDRVIPKSSPRVEYLLARNFILRVRLHTRPWSIRRLFAIGRFMLCRRIPRTLGLLLLPSRRAAGWAALKGLWAGLWIEPDPRDCRL